MTGRVLSLDFESYAKRDLRKVGAYEYVQCPHFEVTAIAWAFDNDPVTSACWPNTGTLPPEIETHIRSGGIIRAWNATFEHTILTDHYKLPVPLEQMSCTMQRALVHGLPGALGDAGPALGLAIVKDKKAQALMMQMGKPRAKGLAWHQTDPTKLAALEAYCRLDVEAEREIGRVIPELTSFEKRVSEIDAASNRAGVLLDENAIRLMTSAREHIRREQAAEIRALTGNAVRRVESETGALLQWLRSSTGLNFNSVDKLAVADALGRSGLAPHVRRVLEIRAEAAKSSLGKLDRMAAVRGKDGRARGLLQYYGAGRTGRWAGRLVQVQNLPRNQPGVDPDRVLGVLGWDIRALELFWDKPLDVLSACLRGCITAPKGKLLAMIDLSQIEARVLAWLAGQKDVLEVFRRGEDVYTFAAGKLGSRDRQLGKVVTLACGYGMGAVKFQSTAEGYGLVMGPLEATEAVTAWRRANPAVVNFWYEMEAAVRGCVLKPGVVQTAGRAKVRVVGGVLYVQKPSGGMLVYHNPRLNDGEIVFDGVYQTSRKWGPQKTYGGKLVENLTQAVARDIVAEAVVRIATFAGMIPVMTVHDELVYEVGDAELAGRLQQAVDMVPGWATGLPVASKLAVGFRYGK